MKILFFDTETTGLPSKDGGLASQPHIVQLGAIVSEYDTYWPTPAKETEIDRLFKPPIPIPPILKELHGIDDEMVKDCPPISEYLREFIELTNEADVIVCHNVQFDMMLLGFEVRRMIANSGVPDAEAWYRTWKDGATAKAKCTKEASTNLCKIPSPSGKRGYKWPKLNELYPFLFGEMFDNAHNAIADVKATQRCYFELVRREIIPYPTCK
jgi:DNA polymerase-3 subunit epsilon